MTGLPSMLFAAAVVVFLPSLALAEGPVCNPPCQHGGTCLDAGGGETVCACADGYRGDTCQDGLCDGVIVCENGGQCTATGTSFHCDCAEGYEGDLCEFEDPCTVCHDEGSTGECDLTDPVCNCKPGFHGDLCDDIDFCHNQDCSNNGECRENVDNTGYVCDCDRGFGGDDCEIDFCLNLNCGGHGRCVANEDNTGAVCRCYYGYSGVNCENGPCHNAPCKNGGKCTVRQITSRFAVYTCTCVPPWKGRNCDRTGWWGRK